MKRAIIILAVLIPVFLTAADNEINVQDHQKLIREYIALQKKYESAIREIENADKIIGSQAREIMNYKILGEQFSEFVNELTKVKSLEEVDKQLQTVGKELKKEK